MADLDDGPPPLEDMTETLMKVMKINDSDNKKSAVVEKVTEDKKLQVKTMKVETKKPVESGFAGFKKGFLLGSTNSKPKPQPTKKEDIPYIKPKQSKESEYQMPEVQAAMKASQSLLDNKEWINNDLFSTLEKNPMLLSKINDPKISCAMTEFQTNPQEAMYKYRDDMEVQQFFKEFCGLLGSHFNNIADNQVKAAASPVIPHEVADLSVHSSTNHKQPTHKDEEKMKEILSKPEVQSTLADPEIQKLFQLLREDPDKAQRILHQSNPSLQSKIHILVEAGLLSYQSPQT